MKKILTLFFVVLPLLASAQQKHANGAGIRSHVDSVNYMFGLANGGGIRNQVIGADTADMKKVEQFLAGFIRAWGVTDGDGYFDLMGNVVGASLANEVSGGYLFNDSTVAVRKEMIVTAFENTINEKAFCMTSDSAISYVQKLVSANMMTGGNCNPTNGQTDTLNICVGYLNAKQALDFVFKEKSTAMDKKHFMTGFKNGLENGGKEEMLFRGMNIGRQFTDNMKQEGGIFGMPEYPVEWDIISKGVQDGVRNNKSFITPAAAGEYLDNLYRSIQDKKNAPLKEAGAKFLADNAKNKDVVTTASGLQYKVVKQGNGAKPTEANKVRVHYTGKLIDGKVFDSSVERGEPLEFQLGQVIKGWQEGLKLMSVGSKYILYIPYELGYGERGAGDAIPPFSTLIFEVELLEILQ